MKSTIILSLFTSVAVCRGMVRVGGVDIVAHDPTNMIHDDYLIVFKKGVNSSAVNNFHLRTNRMHQMYRGRGRTNLKGFAREFNINGAKISHGSYAPQVLASIANDPSVDYIEANSIVSLSSSTDGVYYNLDRISHTPQSADPGDYQTSSYTYLYPAKAGAGVNVYVLDTGIDTTHPDFEGRATWGYTNDGKQVDGNGHGTLCAGLVGSNWLGVAPKANMIAVKVLNATGLGDTSSVLAGLDWAYRDAKTRAGTSVINMSLGTSKSDTFNTAVTKIINDGIVVVVAAGNDNVDSGTTSPASAAGVIVVGASDGYDARWAKSNWGSTVSLFAPGYEVISTIPVSLGSYGIADGTSVASPHVAGIAALIISQAGGTVNPYDVRNTIITGATSVTLKNAGVGSPAKIAFNGAERGLTIVKAPTTSSVSSTSTRASSTSTSTKPVSTTSTSSVRTTTTSTSTSSKPTTTSSSSSTRPTSTSTSSSKPTTSSSSTKATTSTTSQAPASAKGAFVVTTTSTTTVTTRSSTTTSRTTFVTTVTSTSSTRPTSTTSTSTVRPTTSSTSSKPTTTTTSSRPSSSSSRTTTATTR